MLRHDRVRLVVSSLGITFAVLLMFAELGFLNGVYDSVTVPIKSMDADLVVVHSAKENTFPYENLDYLRNIHSATYAMDLEKAIEGLVVPLHPGAAKYYREKGIPIPDDLIVE